jgi:hypothetical protein
MASVLKELVVTVVFLPKFSKGLVGIIKILQEFG